jgi:hypothetical protein
LPASEATTGTTAERGDRRADEPAVANVLA